MDSVKNEIEGELRIESDGIHPAKVIPERRNPRTSAQKKENARYERWRNARLREDQAFKWEKMNQWANPNPKSYPRRLRRSRQGAKQSSGKSHLNEPTRNQRKVTGQTRDRRLRALAERNYNNLINVMTETIKAEMNEFAVSFPEKVNDPLSFIVYQNLRISPLDLKIDLDG